MCTDPLLPQQRAALLQKEGFVKYWPRLGLRYAEDNGPISPDVVQMIRTATSAIARDHTTAPVYYHKSMRRPGKKKRLVYRTLAYADHQRWIHHSRVVNLHEKTWQGKNLGFRLLDRPFPRGLQFPPLDAPKKAYVRVALSKYRHELHKRGFGQVNSLYLERIFWALTPRSWSPSGPRPRHRRYIMTHPCFFFVPELGSTLAIDETGDYWVFDDGYVSLADLKFSQVHLGSLTYSVFPPT